MEWSMGAVTLGVFLQGATISQGFLEKTTIPSSVQETTMTEKQEEEIAATPTDTQLILPLAFNTMKDGVIYKTRLYMSNPHESTVQATIATPNQTCGKTIKIFPKDTITIDNLIETLDCSEQMTGLYIDVTNLDGTTMKIPLVAKIVGDNPVGDGEVGATIPILTKQQMIVPREFPSTGRSIFTFIGPSQFERGNVYLLAPEGATPDISVYNQGLGTWVAQPTIDSGNIRELVDIFKDDEEGFVTGIPYAPIWGVMVYGIGSTRHNLFGMASIVNDTGDFYVEPLRPSKRKQTTIIPFVADELRVDGHIMNTDVTIQYSGDGVHRYTYIDLEAHMKNGKHQTRTFFLHAGRSYALTDILQDLGEPINSIGAVRLNSQIGYQVHAHTLDENLVGETNPILEYADEIKTTERGVFASAGQNTTTKSILCIFSWRDTTIRIKAHNEQGIIILDEDIHVLKHSYTQRDLRDLIKRPFNGLIEVTAKHPFFAVNYRRDTLSNDAVVEKATVVPKNNIRPTR